MDMVTVTMAEDYIVRQLSFKASSDLSNDEVKELGRAKLMAKYPMLGLGDTELYKSPVFIVKREKHTY